MTENDNRAAGDSIHIDLSRLLADPDPTGTRPRRNLDSRNDPRPDETLDDWLLAQSQGVLESGDSLFLEHAIRNIDRTVGARLSGVIAARFGDHGLPPGTIRVTLHGSAGQSFGAFCVQGLQLSLYGEANDYVGKGMGGGEIIIRLPPGARWASQDNFIIGNTCLYGATGGRLFADGLAGERFAVRNSGAVAVVTGVGDHGCEYMTGGAVVVLGPIGRNFAAGMTGGAAYVLDEANKLPVRLNPELVQFGPVSDESDIAVLHALVQEHANLTGSAWSRSILDDWAVRLPQFRKVAPK